MVDNREVIKPSDFEGNQFPFPYSAVAAVDSFFVGEKQEGGIARFFFTSSGVIIDPKHALTTAHSVYTDRKGRLEEGVTATAIRVTNSEEQEKLVSRKVGTSSNDPSRNVDAKDVSFLKNYNKLSILEKDIALLSTVSLAPGDNLLPPEEVFGLIAFVNPADADDNDNESDRNQRRFLVETAGYPGNNAKIPGSTTTPGNEDARRARDLVRSPQNGKETGNIFNLTQRGSFVTSSEISATSGQSGSGIWSTLDGDDPRVLGIITTDSVGLANSRNYGVLITTDVYNSIINQIEVDSGTSNADLLPENAIIGSDPSFLGLVGGNDYIAGTYRKERIIGSGGDDRLYGGGADDRLEGGEGVDQALFSEVFTNYTYTLPNLLNPNFEFNHVKGSRRDARDTTKDIEFGVFEFFDSNGDEKDDDGNLFFVPLQTDTDRNGNIKLKDGSIITPREQVLDADGDNIATMTVESPAWMLDGDVEYDLTIGLDITQSYNLAFIIDNSESTGDGTLSQTKNAVKKLIDAFEESGLDSNINYGIVNFNTTATLVPTDDSTIAKNAINAINSVIDGKTNYSAGLSQGIAFFNPSYIAETLDPIIPDSVFDTPDQRNIAYFISDGQPTLINGTPDVLNLYIPTANRLKLYADEVRAFGTNGATLNKLRIIDSDADPQLLANAGELFDAFDTSIDVNTIESVEVKKVGTDGISELVETIPASKLNKEGLNLTYEGSIDELDVSREAENEITFELIFKDSANIDDVSLDYTITTGQSEIRRLTNNGTREISSFTNNQLDFEDDEIALGALNATGNTVSDRDLVGNDLDNTIKVRRGTNSIFGNGGDDRFSLLGGVNFVNGGEGVDTVILDRTLAEAGEISQSGNLTYIGANVSLVDVEFIQFRDTRLAADTLAIAPTISLEENAISVVEGNTGSSLATFVVNLSNPSTEDVAVDVSFESGKASAIDDFVLPTQPLIIPAGETTGEITLEVVGDELAEGDEEIILDLAVAENATFANGAISETVGINIADDDSEIFVSLIEEESGISEGDLDRPSVFSLTLNRFGGLTNSDVVAVEIVPTEDNSIVAADFVGGISPTGNLVAGLTPIIGDIFGVLPPKLVTFAPGEDSKTVRFAVSPDFKIEDDETFAVELSGISGSAEIFSPDEIFTIFNDDEGNSVVGDDNSDRLKGTNGKDIIEGLAGDDEIFGADGNDVLLGGDDDDTLYGENDSDRFLMQSLQVDKGFSRM